MCGGIDLKLAKVIRVITVPPVMAAWLILTLRFGAEPAFLDTSEAGMALLFLALLPLMAYPIAAAVPSLRAKGRDGQRDMAFALSLAGYIGGWAYSRFWTARPLLRFLFGVYLFSVVILLIFNKLLKLRASGHACSISGPILTICAALRGWWIPVCLALFALSLWSCVRTKRHTVGEYLLGTLSVIMAMILSGLIYLR